MLALTSKKNKNWEQI